jgi:hypothetical protein
MPTRRKGLRTGGIPVPKALVEKILRTIFASEHVMHTVGVPAGAATREERMLAAIFGEDRPMPLVTFLPWGRELGKEYVSWRHQFRFNIQSYVTGKHEALEVVVRDLKRDKFSPFSGGVSGWQTSSSGDLVELPKAQRVERARAALLLLGVEPSPVMIRKVFTADPSFAMYGEAPEQRAIEVNLAVEFEKPLSLKQVENSFRSTLVHEIAHGLDEGLRLRDLRRRKEHEQEDRLDALSDAEDIAFALGLPDPVLPREKAVHRLTSRKKRHFVPTKEYYELPHEVTARIPEIFSQVGQRLTRFKAMLASPGDRSSALLSALRSVSPTFRTGEKNWDQQSLARILRAVYDRYHHEKWFPQATGVYKNRRTSRRRTSRRGRRR